ncbi:hypothetical protein PtB15_17B120 [Puccinia triticina]|nr:hypothetical protein PtB15_17B120 [Puccinia triticina]
MEDTLRRVGYDSTTGKTHAQLAQLCQVYKPLSPSNTGNGSPTDCVPPSQDQNSPVRPIARKGLTASLHAGNSHTIDEADAEGLGNPTATNPEHHQGSGTLDASNQTARFSASSPAGPSHTIDKAAAEKLGNSDASNQTVKNCEPCHGSGTLDASNRTVRNGAVDNLILLETPDSSPAVGSDSWDQKVKRETILIIAQKLLRTPARMLKCMMKRMLTLSPNLMQIP